MKLNTSSSRLKHTMNDEIFSVILRLNSILPFPKYPAMPSTGVESQVVVEMLSGCPAIFTGRHRRVMVHILFGHGKPFLNTEEPAVTRLEVVDLDALAKPVRKR